MLRQTAREAHTPAPLSCGNAPINLTRLGRGHERSTVTVGAREAYDLPGYRAPLGYRKSPSGAGPRESVDYDTVKVAPDELALAKFDLEEDGLVMYDLGGNAKARARGACTRGTCGGRLVGPAAGLRAAPACSAQCTVRTPAQVNGARVRKGEKVTLRPGATVDLSGLGRNLVFQVSRRVLVPCRQRAPPAAMPRRQRDAGLQLGWPSRLRAVCGHAAALGGETSSWVEAARLPPALQVIRDQHAHA